jgi:FMN reductase
MRLIGLSASLTKGGRTRLALEAALAGATTRFPDIDAELIDARDYRVSLCDGRPLDQYPDDTGRLVSALGAGDGYLFATPVYRGSYTGALKNLLDHTPVEALQNKPIGVIAVAATDHHYLVIDQELRPLLAWFGAVVLPVGVYVKSSHFKGETLVDGQVRDHLRELGEAVVIFEQWLRDRRAGPPPLAAWAHG